MESGAPLKFCVYIYWHERSQWPFNHAPPTPVLVIDFFRPVGYKMIMLLSRQWELAAKPNENLCRRTPAIADSYLCLGSFNVCIERLAVHRTLP